MQNYVFIIQDLLLRSEFFRFWDLMQKSWEIKDEKEFVMDPILHLNIVPS